MHIFSRARVRLRREILTRPMWRSNSVTVFVTSRRYRVRVRVRTRARVRAKVRARVRVMVSLV